MRGKDAVWVPWIVCKTEDCFLYLLQAFFLEERVSSMILWVVALTGDSLEVGSYRFDCLYRADVLDSCIS